MQDPAGAFVPGEQFRLEGRPGGPLAGLSFGVKDLYDIAGRRTGGGTPAWKEAHPEAPKHAWAVARLLEAGATALGKTITDELAYSIVGANFHYGTPRNGADPERMPGGSSSGSASAVSNGLVDFALGTDSGGSVRVPATYCGLYGLRPTHGRLPLEGCMPLNPSYDTCGWFARTPQVLLRVGQALFPPGKPEAGGPALRIPPEVWSAASDEVRLALRPALARLEAQYGPARESAFFRDEADWSAMDQCSRTLQAFEAWQSFGPWIESARPNLGPEIEERFRLASRIGAGEAADAAKLREAFRARMAALVAEGAVFVFPTTPTVAPPRAVPPERLQAVRLKTLQFTCIAGLAGLPQLSIPVRRTASAPCGLSLLGARGADESLLAQACEIGTI